jgi:hypothetical protein
VIFRKPEKNARKPAVHPLLNYVVQAA